MSSLTKIEKRKMERLFEMGGGYVLDFSNRTFAEFVLDSTGLDIYSEQYAYGSGSKANRLRAFWETEGDRTVGKLLVELLAHCRELGVAPEMEDLFAEVQRISERLLAPEQHLRHNASAIYNYPASHATAGAPSSSASGGGSGRGRNRVFISYAREDIDYARKMFYELAKASYEPWLDCECLLPGQRWEPTIEQAIRESRFFVALISSRSSAKRGYVQKEIVRALDLLEQIPENQIFLIPARLDECEPSHSALRGVQWVDLFPSWETGVERIFRALKLSSGAA
jgi:hypothetical protein